MQIRNLFCQQNPKLLFRTHPYHPDFKLDQYCRRKGIHLTAYAPLGAGGSGLLVDDTIVSIAKRLGVSAGQVALGWNLAHGRSVVPKSANRQRMHENFTPAHLSAEDVASIGESTGKRADDDNTWKEHIATS